MDGTGMVLLGGCAAWALVTAAAHGGRPEGVLLAVLAVAAGYAAGRICGALLPVAAPAAGAAAGVCLALTGPHLAPGPAHAAPLGRTGATAALLALSVGAACCAAWAARPGTTRRVLCLMAAGIAAAAAAVGPVAGCVACLGVLLCSLAAARTRRAPGLAGLAVAAAAVAGTAWAVAGDALPEGLTACLEGQLTRQRVLLWQDAAALARGNPGLGVGPGRFGGLSPTAARSLLSDGKPHSAPLQQAAEQGVVGLVLLAAVFGWVLYALWRSTRPTPVALSAAAALTALAALASAGNALSFTTVTAGAGLLAGFATARPLADGTEGAGDTGTTGDTPPEGTAAARGHAWETAQDR
ncbi:hypothetical protein GCM10010358_31840 [Streptomyces minutiscleroticus]|uniref:O-antigen ligase-related domain-containing protein n=2 Tax=Streptomyces minutiscleroticus TaxID=68238 RepID=A0A918KVI9_9ACTN|nr:O-antigen ligase family protein [Streptomyces minutiscleroticus]GGX75232.1 hypothetical protein GCM10010358_31840 [Streptomyces minutiscleroticus]